MVETKERPGMSVGGNSRLNSDPRSVKRIINAVIKKQKEIGLEGYISCPICTLGISGNSKITPPEYIAGYCRGDCEILGLNSDKNV